MRPHHLFLLLPVFALGSCASSDTADSTTPVASSGARVRDAYEWLDDVTKDNGFVNDANGNLVPKSDKRSSFESKRQSAYFKGDYNKKQFKTTDYQTKAWWGKSDYTRPVYAGDTDGSRFQTTSNLNGVQSRESATRAYQTAGYNTGSYATGGAREAAGRRLDRPSNAITDNRREVFTAPSMIDWKAERALNMKQSRGILGR